MRVLIVEDETAAYENLVDILGEVSYDILSSTYKCNFLGADNKQ